LTTKCCYDGALALAWRKQAQHEISSQELPDEVDLSRNHPWVGRMCCYPHCGTLGRASLENSTVWYFESSQSMESRSASTSYESVMLIFCCPLV
jgi:hypothetical protein